MTAGAAAVADTHVAGSDPTQLPGVGSLGSAEAEVVLAPISVTATRVETELERIPGAVQVMGRDIIERTDAQRLGDLLELAQGVNLSKRGTRDTVSIRGFSNEQSLILIDGRRLADEPSQKFALDRVTLANVERVEILRGPGSTLYGADALGGVINIVTRRPERNQLEVRTRCDRIELDGSHGCEGDVYGAWAVNDQLALSLSGTLIDQPTVELDSGASARDAERFQDGRLSLDWSITDDWRVLASVSQFDADSYFYALGGGSGQGSGQGSGGQGSGSSARQRWDDNNRRRDFALDLRYQGAADDGRIQLYNSRLDKDRSMRMENAATLKNFDQVRVEKTAIDAHYGWAPLARHWLILGGEYRVEDFKGTTFRTEDEVGIARRGGLSKPVSKASIDYWALFMQDQWQLSPRLDLTLGARYDASDQFDSRVTANIGGVYQLLQEDERSLRVKARFAQGYRVPTMRDLYVDVDSASVSRRGNPDLRPEHSNSFDLAIEGRYREFSARLGGFYNKVQDLIDEESIGKRPDGKPIFRYENIGEATLQGIEASFDWAALADLSLGLEYMYLDARDDTTDERLEDRPLHRFVTTLDYTFMPWGLDVALWGDYNLDVIDSASGEQKNYGLWNLSLSQPLTRQLDLRAGIENLFDERDDDLLLVGRSYYLGLNLSF
ncbi:TonB-dependent receptor plug domain-containing protein [Rhabdochromatium marinum]|uniref:TonB-dependent receptor plug domain-containing protein n=1 Tax=Rhabdochromatium marinum TaxID=48729 RepID=UPI00190420D7|nr:TonB-dependent receptor [Rhabdochromatium marinum]